MALRFPDYAKEVRAAVRVKKESTKKVDFPASRSGLTLLNPPRSLNAAEKSLKSSPILVGSAEK